MWTKLRLLSRKFLEASQLYKMKVQTMCESIHALAMESPLERTGWYFEKPYYLADWQDFWCWISNRNFWWSISGTVSPDGVQVNSKFCGTLCFAFLCSRILFIRAPIFWPSRNKFWHWCCFVGMAELLVKFDLGEKVPLFHVKLSPISCEGALSGIIT